jgi:hypothetical protein
MRKITIAAILLAMGGSAYQAHALDLAGSDTLEDLTIALINSGSCGSGLNYVDGGSGKGETALLSGGTQQIAPMSRKINATTNATCNATGEGMFFAMDAISVVVDSAQTEQCGSGTHIHAARGDAFSADGTTRVVPTPVSGPPTLTYSDMGTDWASKLYALYSGDGTGSNSACSTNATRVALAGNYKSLFPNSCAGGSGHANTCGAIKHLYRRGDASGTTDLFKTLVGTAATGTAIAAFCNGTDQQDRDPIRRTCTADEQVCDTDGKLGLLLPIFSPEVGTANDLVNNAKCKDGKFKRLAGPFNDTACCFRAPDGTCKTKTVGLKCIAPLTTGLTPCLNGNTSDDFGSNVPVGVTLDPRVYNLHVRDNTTTGALRSYRDQTDATSAYYRIHTTTGGIHHAADSGSADLCRSTNNTEMIGCLVQSPNSGCSVGFGGYAAVDGPEHAWAEPLALNAIDISSNHVQNFALQAVGQGLLGDGAIYPLSRKLYLNTLVGFEHVTDSNQLALAACFANISSSSLATQGFFQVPTLNGNVGAAPVCESMCPQSAAVDGGHCGGNLTPFN